MFRYLRPCKEANALSAILICSTRHSSALTRKKGRANSARPGPGGFRTVLLTHEHYVFGEGILLVLAERPRRLEMIVIDEFVHRAMHVPVIGTLQIAGAFKIKR